jgi:uncharacterized protein (DUF305 family)
MSDSPASTTHPEPDETVLPWWMNPVNIVLMVVATAVLAAAGAFVFGESRGGEQSNGSDIGFLQDMRIHHEQAVNMSLIYLDVSAPGFGEGSESRGTLRLIAREIIVNQSNESGRMVQLLRIFDAAETNESDQVMGWMGDPTPLAQMPGYATDDQMEALQQARGNDADRLFAELMIAHHQGGIHMAEHVVDHGKSTEVAAMAASMVSAQQGEISEMEKLLAVVD